ncbi:hypothetical protein DPMN_082992 [Dreissena polymorpha]|uniref:Uncharacterized protein n=1 Tax=Dreissena polymorpha TaxID=45954 RepID=A0A9D3YB19_DREPO|nr:hypothetical protein DPMN_082992 [Dreissena polymorpha]
MVIARRWIVLSRGTGAAKVACYTGRGGPCAELLAWISRGGLMQIMEEPRTAVLSTLNVLGKPFWGSGRRLEASREAIETGAAREEREEDLSSLSALSFRNNHALLRATIYELHLICLTVHIKVALANVHRSFWIKIISSANTLAAEVNLT